jgi:hypothetical protein
MAYVLVICAGISWAGCGHVSVRPFRDEASCSRSLREMRIDGVVAGEGEKRRSMYAYCRPAAKDEVQP